MPTRTPWRYRTALLAWWLAGAAALLAWPVALVALVAPPLQRAILETPLGFLVHVPVATVCAALAALVLAFWITRALPDAGTHRWMRRGARVKAAVRQLQGDCAGLAALVLAWGAFRLYGIAAWQRLRWPVSLGESAEYLLAMGAATGWVLVATGSLAQLWRWWRTR
jgi:hypothetical protein